MGKLIRNGIEYGGGNGTDIFEVDQATYDALKQAGTLVHNALYVITDAPNLNPTASDIEYSGAVTVKQAIDSKADKTISSGSGQATTGVSLIRLTIKEFNGIKFISGALQVTALKNVGDLLVTIDSDYGRIDNNTWDIVGSSPSGSGVPLYISNKVEIRANLQLTVNAVVVFNSWYI